MITSIPLSHNQNHSLEFDLKIQTKIFLWKTNIIIIIIIIIIIVYVHHNTWK